MKEIGILALVAGICRAVFALNMNKSVATGSGGRVNRGLMTDRLLPTIVAGMIALAGLLMVLLGGKSSAPSASTTTDPPLPTDH